MALWQFRGISSNRWTTLNSRTAVQLEEAYLQGYEAPEFKMGSSTYLFDLRLMTMKNPHSSTKLLLRRLEPGATPGAAGIDSSAVALATCPIDMTQISWTFRAATQSTWTPINRSTSQLLEIEYRKQPVGRGSARLKMGQTGYLFDFDSWTMKNPLSPYFLTLRREGPDPNTLAGPGSVGGNQERPGLGPLLEDQQDLVNLLQALQISEKHIHNFIANEVKFEDLPYLSKSDVVDLIPAIGPRTRFLKYLETLGPFTSPGPVAANPVAVAQSQPAVAAREPVQQPPAPVFSQPPPPAGNYGVPAPVESLSPPRRPCSPASMPSPVGDLSKKLSPEAAVYVPGLNLAESSPPLAPANPESQSEIDIVMQAVADMQLEEGLEGSGEHLQLAPAGASDSESNLNPVEGGDAREGIVADECTEDEGSQVEGSVGSGSDSELVSKLRAQQSMLKRQEMENEELKNHIRCTEEKAKAYKKQVEEVKDNTLCVICYENSRNFVFMPCGHISCCQKCQVKLYRCPTCRSFIANRVRTYL
eukprot:125998_1